MGNVRLCLFSLEIPIKIVGLTFSFESYWRTSMEKVIKITPSFVAGTPVDPRLFVGREKQISQVIASLSKSENMNMVVYGPRRVGKTSFLHKIRSIIQEQGTKTLFVDLDLQGQELTDFLPMLFLQTVLTAWKEIFDGSYGELLSASRKPPSAAENINKKKKSLFDFYRLLKNTSTKIGIQKQSDIGAALGLTAKHSEIQDVEFQQTPLGVSELLFSLNDFIKTSLPDYNRILVLTDEASRLPKALGIETLNRYLELLSDYKFQFIFAGVPSYEKSFLDLSVLCPCKLQLGCFDSIESVRDLIQLTLDDFYRCDYVKKAFSDKYKYEKIAVSFAKDTHSKIFELAGGHPLKIQQLCNESIAYALSKNKMLIEIDDVVNAAATLLPQWQKFFHMLS